MDEERRETFRIFEQSKQFWKLGFDKSEIGCLRLSSLADLVQRQKIIPPVYTYFRFE